MSKIESKLDNIHNCFKLPIYYNDKKVELKQHIIDDLELVKTIDIIEQSHLHLLLQQ
jgi:hypothetical protein